MDKNQVCAIYGCTLQLEKMLNSFNFQNITLYPRNGVISEEGPILSKSALLRSTPSILVINNYAET